MIEKQKQQKKKLIINILMRFKQQVKMLKNVTKCNQRGKKKKKKNINLFNRRRVYRSTKSYKNTG